METTKIHFKLYIKNVLGFGGIPIFDSREIIEK